MPLIELRGAAHMVFPQQVSDILCLITLGLVGWFGLVMLSLVS